jgi:predicted acylesterase/phospholipase RssA
MFDDIIISGGASRVYYPIGCAYKYEAQLVNARRYVGTSAGGLLCLLLVCGFRPIDIFKFSLTCKCNVPKNRDEWIQALFNIMDRYGILENNPYIRNIEKLIKKKYGFIPTLKQLFELTGKELILTTCNVTAREAICLSAETHPNMLCTLAADMTSRIPPLFTPILYGGHLYVDGGVSHHLPIEQVIPGHRTLVMYIGDQILGPVNNGRNVSITSYFGALANLAIKGRYSQLYSTDDVVVHVFDVETTEINVSKEEALAMFLIGFGDMPVPARFTNLGERCGSDLGGVHYEE